MEAIPIRIAKDVGFSLRSARRQAERGRYRIQQYETLSKKYSQYYVRKPSTRSIRLQGISSDGVLDKYIKSKSCKNETSFYAAKGQWE